MPQTTPERAARWPGGDSEAIKYLRGQGYILQQPSYHWLTPTPDHEPTDKEHDALLYLIQEWDYGCGFITRKLEE